MRYERPAKCGTAAGLLAHEYRGEEPCDACIIAWQTFPWKTLAERERENNERKERPR